MSPPIPVGEAVAHAERHPHSKLRPDGVQGTGRAPLLPVKLTVKTFQDEPEAVEQPVAQGTPEVPSRLHPEDRLSSLAAQPFPSPPVPSANPVAGRTAGPRSRTRDDATRRVRADQTLAIEPDALAIPTESAFPAAEALVMRPAAAPAEGLAEPPPAVPSPQSITAPAEPDTAIAQPDAASPLVAAPAETAALQGPRVETPPLIAAPAETAALQGPRVETPPAAPISAAPAEAASAAVAEPTPRVDPSLTVSRLAKSVPDHKCDKNEALVAVAVAEPTPAKPPGPPPLAEPESVSEAAARTASADEPLVVSAEKPAEAIEKPVEVSPVVEPVAEPIAVKNEPSAMLAAWSEAIKPVAEEAAIESIAAVMNPPAPPTTLELEPEAPADRALAGRPRAVADPLWRPTHRPADIPPPEFPRAYYTGSSKIEKNEPADADESPSFTTRLARRFRGLRGY